MALPPAGRAESHDLVEELAAAQDARRVLERDLARLKDQNAALLAACASAEAANRARGEFISGLGGEIRTPLNGLVGMVGILAQTRLDPNQTQITRAIETSARSLSTLLHDVLELAALDAGPLDLDLQGFSLDDAAAEFERRYAPDMAGKGLGFAVRAAARARGLELVGDAPRIRQAVGRLLRHALGSTDRGEVTLDLDFTGDGDLVITVAGAGVGPDPSEAVGFFEGDARPKALCVRPHDRSGLGLAIGRGLFEAMGGGVRAEVVPAQAGEPAGVRFTATLPLARREAKAA